MKNLTLAITKILLIFHPRSYLMFHHIAKSFASYVVSKNQSWIKKPIQSQTKTLETLINNGQKTLFGQQHFFKDIRKYGEFKESIPWNNFIYPQGFHSFNILV